MNKRGKITLFVLITSIILVGFFSFYFVLAQSENTKTYDSVNKVVTIKSSSGSVISDITLNTPQVFNVIRGNDRKVAEFTIDNKISSQQTSSVLEKLDFYDVKNNMQKFNRHFEYKYKNSLGFETVNDYETVCVDGEKTSNGTILQDCSQVLTGTHQEEIFEWVNLNDLGQIPSGKTTIGIFTDVLPNERIEWVPTMLGVEITEWAEWAESLNNSILAYWKLDEQDTSGFGVIFDELNSYNGTNNNSVNTTGKINTAYNFTTSQNIDMGINSNLSLTGDNYTISLWVNTIVNSGTQRMLGTDDGVGTGGGYSIMFDGTNTMIWVANNAGSHAMITTYTPPTNTWVFLTFVFEKGVQRKFYVNGNVFENSSDYNFNLADEGNDPFWIGNIPVHNQFFKGKIDEVAIWSRALNSSEISDLHNNGEGLSYGQIEETPPTTTQPVITPSSPFSNESLNCNATLTDAEQLNLTANWTWYKNNVTNLTGGTVNLENNTNELITTLDSGNTTKGEEWICKITPYDGFQNGTAVNSTSVIILNSVPTHNNPLLNTSTGKSLSTENLTCETQNLFDNDDDYIVNITNWYKDNQSIFALLMPFEINAEDYSGNDNNGNISGAIPTTGKLGLGNALSFDGVDDSVDSGKDASLNVVDEATFAAWINITNLPSPIATILTKGNVGGGSSTMQYNLRINSGGTITFTLSNSTHSYSFHTSTTISPNNWYYVVGTFDLNNTLHVYINGEEQSGSTTGTQIDSIGTTNINFYVGKDVYTDRYAFNGSIDEVRVYKTALTPEQISNNFNLNYNTIVSQETLGGDIYQCQVTPNDGEADGTTRNSSTLEVLWGITFNVTSGEEGNPLPNFNINCNNSFSVSGVNSPYETGFLPGSYSCTFSKAGFYDRIKPIVANVNKTIDITLSARDSLTIEEHTWLEAIYNCVVLGDCSLYNLLLQINNTVGNIWEHTKPTDESVITFENVTSRVVNSTNNLTIDYSVNIPVKAGYGDGDYLPVRIGFWFMDETNTTCFNQGDKPTGVSEPYCQPLIVETIGPMDGIINFTVELQPSLLPGNYSIKRIIDIDPLGVWYNYGQEVISSFTMLESLSTYGASVEITGEAMPEKSLIQNIKSGITGAVSGVGEYLLLSGWQIVFIVGIISMVLVVFIVIGSRTLLRLKGK